MGEPVGGSGSMLVYNCFGRAVPAGVGSSAAGLRQGRHEAEDQNLGSTYNATVIGESLFDAEHAAFRA
ncbi:hypothetical protein [Rhizobium sp. WYCCWR 11128]|uniref:hypothetical protein n=1 Tax=Rhizobium sp. WYCCWR 11128 TaxID=2749832 RepID=UPI0015D2C2B4|nr:hypothetical protein [Rhizobium sp. WYCCWR 11128]NYT29409.1 hypothetical protein [Rhizobium sp. WYCCWR 11128]